MAQYLITDSLLNALADSVSTKTGAAKPLTIGDMTDAVDGITSRTASDLTASGATVTVPAGLYAAQATKSVATGTAGTPTASKGAVLNHSVNVTPSVTNTAGYITGGTKTGTAVNVSASELVSGTKSITANGTGIDVTNYAAVDVSVSGGGGADMPTFTLDSTMTSVTCDKTFAECAEYTGNDIIAALVDTPYGLMTAYNTDGSVSQLRYVISDPVPEVDIVYNSNGTISLVSPSTYRETLSVIQNGTYYPTQQNKAITEVTVNVPSSQPTLQTKTKTYTPSTSQQTESITADQGYDGLSAVNVTVNAMPTGSVTAPATISGTTATVSTSTNTLTLSKTVSVTPNVTQAGYVSAGTAGNSSVSLTANVTTQAAQTIYPSTSDQTINASRYLTGTQTIKGVAVSNTLTADNIKNGVTITIGDSADADRITSVTGTYTGGGGTSKNAQVVQQNSTRITATTYTKACGDITVSKTGTYNVYWTAYRTSTSGTWGTQLYIDNAAYGTAQTTFSNSYFQAIHLSNVSLTANQTVAVYGRSRGSNYYLYVGQLTIIEA